MSLHGIGVQCELRPSAQRHTSRRHDHRKRRATNRHHAVLKCLAGECDVVPGTGRYGERHQRQIGADTEGARIFVADDHAVEAKFLDLVEGAFEPFQHAVTEAVHLRAELETGHAVAEVDEAGEPVVVEHASALCQTRQRQAAGDAGNRFVRTVEGEILTVFVKRTLCHLEQRRNTLAMRAELAAQPLDPKRVHDLKRARLPAIAPLHGAVDRHDVVRQFSGVRERIMRGVGEKVAQERAVRAGHRDGGRQSLGDRHTDRLTDVTAFEPLLRHVASGFPVECLRPVICFGVEAAARLVAELSGGHQGVEHPRWQRKIFSGRTTDALGDVGEHVESREVSGTERGGACATDERAGEAVHFIDAQSVLLHASHRADHAIHAQTIGDKAGHVFGDHDPLAQRTLGELARGSDHRRVRVRSRNDLEQVHVARRIEEVGAEKAATEFFAATFEQHRHRNARCVRRYDRRGLHQRFDARKQLLLRFGEFDDRFADPVALGEELEMILGVAGAHAGGGRRFHERRRLGLDRLLQPVPGGRASVGRLGVAVAGDIEQHDTAAGRGSEGGNAASHGPGAHHADSRHAHSELSVRDLDKFRRGSVERKGRRRKTRRWRHVPPPTSDGVCSEGFRPFTSA